MGQSLAIGTGMRRKAFAELALNKIYFILLMTFACNFSILHRNSEALLQYAPSKNAATSKQGEICVWMRIVPA
jgi:hypothetical protein